MEKRTTRKQQAIDTKNRLITVIQELLKVKTFDELSIEDICKGAGVSTGAFYHHFGSKDGIIVELYRNTDEYFEKNILRGLQSSDPAERILEYLACQCGYAQELGLSLISNVYKAQINHGNSFFLSGERGLPKGLRRLVEEAQAQGRLITTADAAEITSELLIVSRGIIYNWCLQEASYDICTLARKILGRYLNTFLA
jgi:AcrR family transcriptional regulator